MTDRQPGPLAGDIATARSQGVTDDDILAGYRRYAPEEADDIDRLVGEGLSARELVDGLTVYQGRTPPQDTQDTQGTLEKTSKALQYGAAQAAVGLGRTAHWLGEASGIDTAKSVGNTIAEAGRGIAPNDYRPASAEFFNPQAAEKGVGGYGWGYLPRMVLEGAPGLAMDIAAGAATGGAGFLASNAARSFGPAVDARVENNGGREASASDYAIAAGSSALQAALGKLGINPALSGVTKGAGLGAIAQIPGQIAKAGAVDAASGAAGAVIDRAAVTAGTDKGLTIDPHEALGSAVASGATGGAIRSLRGIGDVTNAVRYADMDSAVAQRLATKMDAFRIDPDNPKDAYNAISITEKLLTQESSRVRRDYGKDVDPENKRSSDKAMDTAQAILGAGGTLTDKHFSDIRDAVGDNPFGKRYLERIEERNVLNQLKSKGRYDDGAFSGGLSSSPIVEGMINPASWVKNPTKRALGGTAAILGFGTELEAARALLAPAALAKSMAIQGAAYGGIRAFDHITGSRNPLKEFTGRFGGHSTSRASPEADVPAMARALSEAETTRVHEAVSRAVASPRKATESPVEAQGQPFVDKGSSERAKAADEPSSGSGDRIDPQMVRIEFGPYVVNRAREDIGNVKAYVAKTKSRMETRAQLGDDIEAIAGPQHTRAIQGLIDKLNNQARSADDAGSFVEDTINSLPWDKRSKAWDAYLTHQHKIAATYRR